MHHINLAEKEQRLLEWPRLHLRMNPHEVFVWIFSYVKIHVYLFFFALLSSIYVCKFNKSVVCMRLIKFPCGLPRPLGKGKAISKTCAACDQSLSKLGVNQLCRPSILHKPCPVFGPNGCVCIDLPLSRYIWPYNVSLSLQTSEMKLLFYFATKIKYEIKDNID